MVRYPVRRLTEPLVFDPPTARRRSIAVVAYGKAFTAMAAYCGIAVVHFLVPIVSMHPPLV
jgi:hypothetical protein